MNYELCFMFYVFVGAALVAALQAIRLLMFWKNVWIVKDGNEYLNCDPRIMKAGIMNIEKAAIIANLHYIH